VTGQPTATEELLGESVSFARAREQSAFDALAGRARKKIVLFGAGRLGIKTLHALRDAGEEPLAFADNDANKVGSSVEGIEVFSLEKAARLFRDEGIFIVTTWRPEGGGMFERLRCLSSLRCDIIGSYITAGWRFDGILPHFAAERPSRLLEHRDELIAAAGVWSDSTSMEIFRQQLAWRLRGEFHGVSAPVGNQYFPEEIDGLNSSELFVDCGAFDGDTIQSIHWPIERVIAIEPDPVSAAKLRSRLRSGDSLHQVLVGETQGIANFNAEGTMASARSDSGLLSVPMTTLDALLQHEEPTFIKLDVEGDEMPALRGALRTLTRTQPVVAVCAYHRPDDIWEIPLFLKRLLPENKMLLRAHAFDGFELVVYSIPPSRMLRCP